jgi:hypothetical protein
MGKKDKALTDLFDRRKTEKMKFRTIISLLKSLGAEVDDSREGSSVFISMRSRNGDETRIYNFHKPHPEKEVKAYVVRALRDFLQVLGYWPANPEEERSKKAPNKLKSQT